MLLTITQLGYQTEQEALANGAEIPRLDRFLIGAGPAADDPTAVTAVTAWHEAPIITAEQLSAGALKLTAEIGADVEGYVREIALAMEDGTIYAYAPYQSETDGLFKGEGFAFSLYVIISRENINELNVTYAALDVDALAQQIADEATARIDAAIDESMIQIVTHLSGLNRDVLAQQDKINTLEYGNV